MQKFTKTVGTLSQAQGQPDERCPADGHSNARVLRFFHNDSEPIELAWRAFPVDCDLSKSDTLFMIPADVSFPFISTPAGLPVQPASAADGRLDVVAIAPATALAGMDPSRQK